MSNQTRQPLVNKTDAVRNSEPRGQKKIRIMPESVRAKHGIEAALPQAIERSGFEGPTVLSRGPRKDFSQVRIALENCGGACRCEIGPLTFGKPSTKVGEAARSEEHTSELQSRLH